MHTAGRQGQPVAVANAPKIAPLEAAQVFILTMLLQKFKRRVTIRLLPGLASHSHVRQEQSAARTLKPLFRAGGLGRGLVQIVDEPGAMVDQRERQKYVRKEQQGSGANQQRPALDCFPGSLPDAYRPGLDGLID